MKTRLFALAALAVIALVAVSLVHPDAASAAAPLGAFTMAWVPVVGSNGQPINFPYTHVALTETINEAENQFGMLEERNIAPEEPIMSTVVELTIDGDELYVLATSERGGPAQPNGERRGQKIYLEVPHITDLSVIKPEDLQNMVSLTQQPHAPMTFEEALDRRIARDRAKHDLTLEYFRVGALKGQIYDGDLRLVHDLYQAFGLTKKVINFELDDPDTNVLAKCDQLVAHVRVNLKGEVMRGGVEVLVSTEFFSALIGHSKVEKFWLNAEQALALANPQRVERGGQYGRTFYFGNITWTEYDATTARKNGEALRFIDEGKGHAFPLGTMNAFRTYLAPANDIRFVNQPGRRIYMSPEVLKHGQGIELKTESNPLPVWRRMACTAEVTMQ